MWTPPSQPSTTQLWGPVALTRVDFLVAAHTIGVHDALEAGCEARGTDERGRHVPVWDAVNHSAHTLITLGHPAGRQRDKTGGRVFRDPQTPQPGQVETQNTEGAGWGSTGDPGADPPFSVK